MNETTPAPGNGLPVNFTGKVMSAIETDRGGRDFRTVAYFRRGLCTDAFVTLASRFDGEGVIVIKDAQ